MSAYKDNMYHHKSYLLRRLTSDLNKVLRKALDLMSPYDLFKDWLAREKIKITKAKFEKINRFVELLIRKNLSLNLTRIVSEEEVWVKHIFDSLVASRYLEFKEGMTVMDLGTGGGLPLRMCKDIFRRPAGEIEPCPFGKESKARLGQRCAPLPHEHRVEPMLERV